MIEICMPAVGDGVTEATIVAWHFGVGDTVRRGDILLEIMTDKVAVDVASEQDGVLAEILSGADSEVRVGAVIARIQPSTAIARE